jgi:hypothetical protein
MIKAGSSTPQVVTLTGSGFPIGARVLVTPPGCTDATLVTPLSVTPTAIVFTFVFFAAGDYSAEVTDATGLCDTCPSLPFTLTATPPPCPDIRAFKTFGQLTDETMHLLGDDDGVIWPRNSVLDDIVEGYRILANKLPIFFDAVYLENLPRGFSVTQPWELDQLPASGGFNYGVANFTAEFERRAGQSLGWDERDRYGPGNHTSPFEATDGLLARAGASTDIPAVAEVPATLTQLDRVTWDGRGIDPLEPRSFELLDSRYEVTKGEVYAFMWQKDGVRSLRKVRVPAAQAETYVVNGSWGILRTPADLSSDVPTGTWGVPRIIEGQHALGPEGFGLPRRVYKEQKNVRVEHFRQGRVYVNDFTVCELPPRYAAYLRDYALSHAYHTPGPGFDLKLSKHYDGRWERDVKRVTRRIETVDTEHVHVMGAGRPNLVGPPRPKYPWQYGSRVR